MILEHKMSQSVFVAGVGVIAGIGNNKLECLNALENGQAGMDKIRYLDTVHKDTFPVAEVKLSNNELATLSGFGPGISRTAMLSLIAAREALHSAGIESFASLRTGFISANTVGGMDKTEDFFTQFMANPKAGRLRNLVNQ